MALLAGSSRLLRAINEHAALAHLLDRGPITRGDLRTLTGLSKPTISEVMRRLTDAGLAIVVGRTSGGPGPTAEVYAVNPDAAYAVALVVRTDGTVSAAVADLTGRVRTTLAAPDPLLRRRPVPTAGQVIGAVAGTVDAVCRAAGIDRGALDHVQLGVPGSYDADTDTIRYVDLPGWDRPGLVAGIADRIGTPVGVDNDVNLAATAERRDGAGAGAGSFALLWLGDGLGLAIDLGGELLRGGRGGAGEIGYMPVGAGERRDFQDLVGGPAVVRLARDHGIRVRRAQRAVTLALAAADDDEARRFLGVLAEHVAIGLAAVVAVLDPPRVVLAGPVGRAGGARFAALVTDALHALGPLRTEVTATALDDDPVLAGALHAGVAAVRAGLLGEA